MCVYYFIIFLFEVKAISIECHSLKPKPLLSLANHRYTVSAVNQTNAMQYAGKRVQASHGWFWVYSVLIGLQSGECFSSL